MKRFLLLCLTLAAPLLVRATSYTFTDTSAVDTKGKQTSGGDGTSSTLDSLTHGTAYTWGFSNSTSGGGTSLSGLEAAVHSGTTDIKSATLTITGISDWTSESNDVLYVDILNGLLPGAKVDSYISSPITDDTFYGGDPFNPNSKLAYYDPTSKTYYNPANGKIYNSSGVATGATSKTVPTGYETYNSVLTSTTAYKSGAFKFNSAVSTGSESSLIQGDVYGQTGTSKGQPVYGNTGTLSAGTFTADDTTSTFSITITLSQANLNLLDSYLSADYGNNSTSLGLGFGPDCHFSDTGISLCITTGTTGGGGGGGGGGGSGVPDTAATWGLLSLGLLGCLSVRRRRTV